MNQEFKNKKELSKEFRNKTAVALKYDMEKDTAPKIIATGKGYLADKIIETAKQENVPVHQDAEVAKSLSKLELGDNVPPELYEVVAQIMIYVDRVDGLKGKN